MDASNIWSACNQDLSPSPEKSVFRATNKMMEAVIASEVLEDENMKVDLPIEQVKMTTNIHYTYWIPKLGCSNKKAEYFILPQMEVKEVEEEQNSYEDPRPECGGDSPAKNFPTHPNSTATSRSYPSKTNKVKDNLVCAMPSQHRIWMSDQPILTFSLLYCALTL